MSSQRRDGAAGSRRGFPIALLALLAIAAAGRAAAGERVDSRLEKGKFLVASRALVDPHFARTVVLLVEYSGDGALGVIVNRPTEVPLGEALPEVKELARRRDVIYLGGPVGRERMLVLLRTRNEPPEALRIFGRVFASGSLSALRASVTRGEGVRAYAGYAGWGAGQLDREVARGDWLIGPADADAVFAEHPTEVWDRLIERFTGEWAMATGLAGR
jgi:putative transcriptional regulator